MGAHRSPIFAWLSFWAAVVGVDIAYDLLQARALDLPHRALDHQVQEWVAFWGTWMLVGLLVLPVRRVRLASGRDAVGLVAVVLALPMAHLGAAALAFGWVEGVGGSAWERWIGFSLHLWARDLLIGGASIAVLRATYAGEEARAARLVSLRRQLRPHFLLNVLNGLSGVVRAGDDAAAVEIIARLGALLRAELQHPPIVALRQELRLVRDYLALEALRMGPRMQVDWRIDAEVGDALVPSFLVQPMAENAVRHGVERSAAPVRILISVDRADAGLHICVDDTGPGPTSGEGVGLSAIRSRLALLYGDRARCALGRRPGGGSRVHVVMPYVVAS